MKRYILTGTPGCGKTSILRALEIAGHAVIEEAATDVIALEQALGNAEPHTDPSFIDKIVSLQKHRQLQVVRSHAAVQFFDRSPICTHALCRFLGYPIPAALDNEIARIGEERIYRSRVFFFENLGFVESTAARRITFEQSLVFERIHEESYRAFGFEPIRIPKRPLPERVALVEDYVSRF